MMADAMAMGIPLDDVAHIIQVALTPVFLLSGIASLLNVINARLGRVADQCDALHDRLASAAGVERLLLLGRIRRMRRRLRALDASRAAGAMAGICICGATFALFLGALQNTAIATALFLSFGASVLCTMGALAGFFVEVLLSWRRSMPGEGGGPAA